MNASLEILPAKKVGYTFRSRGKYLASRYNPEAEAKRILEKVFEKNKTGQIGKQIKKVTSKKVIFLGFFPAYPIYFLYQKTPELSINIFDEISFPMTTYREVLLKIHSLKPLGENDLNDKKNHQFLLELEKKILPPEKLSQFLNALTKDELKNLIILESPYLAEPLRKKFKSIIKSWGSKKIKVEATEAYFNYHWIYNSIKNLFYRELNFIEEISLRESSAASSNNNATCVLLVSGPSLEKNLVAIKELSLVFPIFSVAGISELLLKHKIIPTALVSSDAGYYNTLHFKNIPDATEGIPIILSLTSNISIGKKNPTFFFVDLEEIFSLLKNYEEINPINFVPMNASITLTAITLFKKLGFKNVIIFGNDFSHHPFKAHAGSNTSEEIAFSTGKRTFSSENILLPFFKDLKVITNPAGEKIFQEEKLDLYKKHFSFLEKSEGIKIHQGESFFNLLKSNQKSNKKVYDNFFNQREAEKNNFLHLIKNSSLESSSEILRERFKGNLVLKKSLVELLSKSEPNLRDLTRKQVFHYKTRKLMSK